MKFLKGSKIYSILTGVCPVCHNESMYLNGNAYQLSDTLAMHERCSHCNTKYKIEPSFFYGAMYVSYAVGVAFAFATFMIAHYLIGFGLLGSFFAIVFVLVLSLPIILRLSRNIWINLFMKYDKAKAGN